MFEKKIALLREIIGSKVVPLLRRHLMRIDIAVLLILVWLKIEENLSEKHLNCPIETKMLTFLGLELMNLFTTPKKICHIRCEEK